MPTSLDGLDKQTFFVSPSEALPMFMATKSITSLLENSGYTDQDVRDWWTERKRSGENRNTDNLHGAQLFSHRLNKWRGEIRRRAVSTMRILETYSFQCACVIGG